MKTGVLKSGIVTLQVAPREWIDTVIEVDFDSGKIKTAVSFITGKDWLTLAFASKSYDYNDTPKSNKSGAYREITAAGILNNYDADVQQVIDTLRYHELVVMLMDKNKRIRLIGNTEAGMAFSAGDIIKNAANQDTVSVSLIMECEDHPPFYEV